jgi:hypothetical protein
LESKFNRDVLLSLDWCVVQECGVEMPLANRAYHRGEQEYRTGYRSNIRYLPSSSDGGAHFHDFFRFVSIALSGLARLSVGDEITSLQSCGLTIAR